MINALWGLLGLIGVGGSLMYGYQKMCFPSLQPWMTAVPIAHRGIFNNKNGLPENSLAAFQKAIEKGYAIELDVWLSQDNHVVVFHDQNLKRMTGVDQNLKTMLVKDLKTTTLLNTNETIPTLTEVLDLVAGKVPVYVEIKTEDYQDASQIEPAVAKVLDAYQKDYGFAVKGEYASQKVSEEDAKFAGKFAVISFNPDTIAWFRKNRPEMQRGQSYYPVSLADSHPLKQIARVLWWSLSSRPYFLIYNHEGVHQFAQTVLKRFMPLISYNVNSKAQADHAKKHASNIIFETIVPETPLKHLDER